jgi:hypothetical protein
LLVPTPLAVESAAIADPRLQLTAQELTYAAQGLRGFARRAERDAADPNFVSCRAIFEHSAKVYDAVAVKFDEIVKRARE